MSASECLMSPPRSWHPATLSCLDILSKHCSAWKVLRFSVTRALRWPQSQICPATFSADALHASRFASTALSMYVKSRLCSPSPKMLGCWPRSICVINFASTPEYRGEEGILARSKDVEVPQAYCFQSVAAVERNHVVLACELGNRIRRDRVRNDSFVLRQRRRVPIGRRRCRIDNPLHLRVPRGNQHIHRAVDTGRIAPERIKNGLRHRKV